MKVLTIAATGLLATLTVISAHPQPSAPGGSEADRRAKPQGAAAVGANEEPLPANASGPKQKPREAKRSKRKAQVEPPAQDRRIDGAPAQ